MDRLELRCPGCRRRHVLTGTDLAKLKKGAGSRKPPEYSCAACGMDLTASVAKRLAASQPALAPVPARGAGPTLIAPVGTAEALGGERRRFARRPARLQVIYRVKPPKKSRIPSPGPRMGRTMNVGEGGLELIVDEPIPPGPLHLTLILRRQVRISVDAEVIWSAEVTPGREYRYGVEFGEMAAEAQRIWGLFMKGGFARDDDEVA
jgi:hypothetical protein